MQKWLIILGACMLVIGMAILWGCSREAMVTQSDDGNAGCMLQAPDLQEPILVPIPAKGIHTVDMACVASLEFSDEKDTTVISLDDVSVKVSDREVVVNLGKQRVHLVR